MLLVTGYNLCNKRPTDHSSMPRSSAKATQAIATVLLDVTNTMQGCDINWSAWHYCTSNVTKPFTMILSIIKHTNVLKTLIITRNRHITNKITLQNTI